MPYITRDDGEHFVIPSYRDVLSSKNKTQLKKDILLLSQSYGEYITLQRKTAGEYEIAFSPDTGYLLGESIWHYFKRPADMIYCEAIPNTTEAILVIVKAGSVYLDGRFPVESIAEELIIFLTQENNFEIYIYGDVPLAETPTEGKFSFDANSVKSFKILDQPVFPTLPLVKIYQLRLVDVVLKAYGIGVFPTGKILTGVVILGLVWMLYSYLTKPSMEIQPITAESPYALYYGALTSPAPDQEITKFLDRVGVLYTLPGWTVTRIDYAKRNLNAKVESNGSSTQNLLAWAKQNNAEVDIQSEGIFVKMNTNLINRFPPATIYSTKEVIANFIDKLAKVYPGNHIKIDVVESKGTFKSTKVTINLAEISPVVLNLIGSQFKDLPFVLDSIALEVNNGVLSGVMTTHIFGS